MQQQVEKIYRLLLRLYPRAFRREYGEEMERLFRDVCRDAYRKSGKSGVFVLWLFSIFDLIKTCMEEWMTAVNWRRVGIRGGVFLSGFVGLGVSWYVVYGMMIVATSFYLVPWDTSIVRPPEGTLAKAVNDFFELPPGSFIPAGIILAVSVGMFLRAWRKFGLSVDLPWRFALFNVLFMFAQVAVFGVAVLFNGHVIPLLTQTGERGFHLSVIPLLIEFVALFFYIKAQIRAEIPTALQIRRKTT